MKITLGHNFSLTRFSRLENRRMAPSNFVGNVGHSHCLFTDDGSFQSWKDNLSVFTEVINVLHSWHLVTSQHQILKHTHMGKSNIVTKLLLCTFLLIETWGEGLWGEHHDFHLLENGYSTLPPFGSAPLSARLFKGNPAKVWFL